VIGDFYQIKQSETAENLLISTAALGYDPKMSSVTDHVRYIPHRSSRHDSTRTPSERADSRLRTFSELHQTKTS
jgi:hypothetical protein